MSETSEPGSRRAFAPYLSPGGRVALRDLLRLDAGLPRGFATELRDLARRYIDDGESASLRAICLLVADLCEQGWRVDVTDPAIVVAPPASAPDGRQSVADVKARVRHAMQAARLRQLQSTSVREFLHRAERRTQRPQGRHSVLDLVDDGNALARDLTEINRLPDGDRAAALAGLIRPDVEVCEAGAKCRDTGLPLTEIWRYFRHTWSHEYRPIPGRQMLLLIRNAARPLRPVMGIAMLASPVMRLGARDRWIGWLREAVETRLNASEIDPVAFAAALLQRVEASIAAIRWDDLATAAEIARPSERVVLRLNQRSAGAGIERGEQLRKHFDAHPAADGKVPPHRGDVRHGDADADWRTASDDLLFVGKRAETLSHLLFAREVFAASGLSGDPTAALRQLLTSKAGQRAIDIVLAEFRKSGLSSEVSDVSVCGAIHPYNELLGGKLVTLLLTSREVREAYARRYGGQVSFIASQMAGRAITKPSDLKVLTTTSLYGVGSSQYNRLVLNVEGDDGRSTEIRWGAIGKSLTGGYGTFHLSAETAQALGTVALTRHDARRVNNRFGEGTSPRLRQIREGLDALGLKSDTILHHATPRIFYGCELYPGARNALIGLDADDRESPTVAAVAAAWQGRWLSARARRPETLEALRSLGASSVRASLHPDPDDQLTLPIPEA